MSIEALKKDLEVMEHQARVFEQNHNDQGATSVRARMGAVQEEIAQLERLAEETVRQTAVEPVEEHPED